MKKLIFTFLTMATLQMNAAILVVKEYGVNATYSTIASALTAAVNNDTIVVYDKPSGQQWIENLTIDKNITFLHPTQGTRFKAPGSITIVPKAGMDLYLIGWDLDGKNIAATTSNATATSSNRAKITIGDCLNVASISLDVDWIESRIYYNSVIGGIGNGASQGLVTYYQDLGNNNRRARVVTSTSHGYSEGSVVTISGISNPVEMNGVYSIYWVSGNEFFFNYYSTSTLNPNTTCVIGVNTAGIVLRHGLAVANQVSNGGIKITPESTTFSASDSVIVVGNKARWCYFNSQESGLIANNFFNNSSATPSGYWGDEGNGNALSVRNYSQSVGSKLTIINNSIINTNGGGGTRMALAITNSGNVSNIHLVNNLVAAIGTNGTNYGIWFETVSGLPFISHNYINTQTSGNYCNFSFNNELNYTSNTANAYGSIDTWGRASSGNTNLINKGNYLGEYYDIDLTRNDIGTYGGPYSIDNYLTSGTGKGKVLYVNIKHQLTNLNQILNIKGSAGAKF